ncbi:MAG: hypothetical protein MUF72_14795 [Elainella sp. Prado103]|jgi:hypothetical protein|nr:hypothetical protein [Elainella sp. Prado103]
MSVNSGNRTRTTYPKSSQIQSGTIRQAGKSLQNLPQKTQATFSLQEAIHRLRHPLRLALMKGYSYHELAAILRAQGISIRESTLKTYLALAQKTADRTQAESAVKSDFWNAYQDSLQEREEVYRRLATS